MQPIKEKGPCSSYHYQDPFSLSHIENALFSLMCEENPDYSREILYLCIGTDRATGDCLGPLVGTRLQAFNNHFNIFGTLEYPTHATNMQQVLDNINQRFYQPLIIAVDACLGKSDRIGFINIQRGSLKPGTALKKVLPEVGDFHISGVVNVGGFLEHMVLQNTRLNTVYRMADTIAKGLYLAQCRYENHLRPITSRAHS
ncbi:spore protease YyaC [Syntrophomonas erecta]